jgi:hypothetical protein
MHCPLYKIGWMSGGLQFLYKGFWWIKYIAAGILLSRLEISCAAFMRAYAC